ADPIFLHAKTGIEFLLVVAVTPHTGGRNQFVEQIRGSKDGTMLNDAEVGIGNEKQIRLNGVPLVKNHIQRGKENLAQLVLADVCVQDAEQVSSPVLMPRIRDGSHQEI